MKPCLVGECGSPLKARGYCNKHYELLMKYGSPYIRIRRERGTGTVAHGHVAVGVDGRRAFAHVLIAERALGRLLPKGACVHHADGDRANNSSGNLVICPDQAYHSLLHKRMRALAACGRADWLKCKHCKTWGQPADFHIYASGAVHPKCASAAALHFKRLRRQHQQQGVAA